MTAETRLCELDLLLGQPLQAYRTAPPDTNPAIYREHVIRGPLDLAAAGWRVTPVRDGEDCHVTAWRADVVGSPLRANAGAPGLFNARWTLFGRLEDRLCSGLETPHWKRVA